MARKYLYRSAITGRIITEKYALANPDTTVKETIYNLREELIDFCDFCEENGRTMDYSLIDKFLKK